jgi:hypothetical protein
VLSLDGTPPEECRQVDLRKIGLAVTRLIETRFKGDRRAATQRIARDLARTLGVARLATVMPRIAPVAALIPDLARWSPTEKRRLAAVMLAKEGSREGPFLLAMMRHERFRRFIATRF